jgi:putative ABC transport system permease protein
MVKNYFKIAWRNITRNKTYSVINIAGLAIATSCVIFILLYIQDELSYDRFLEDGDRIYQVNLNGNFQSEAFLTSNTPPTVGPALFNEFPEIAAYTRIFRPGNTIVRSTGTQGENYFNENRIFGVDSSFLQIFEYPLIEGDAASCLRNTNSIVITQRMALKYFGKKNAMSETLLLRDSRIPFTVTGILRDLPSQSSLQFDFLTPISAYPLVKQFSWSWVWLQVATYVRLRDDFPNDQQHIAKLEASFPAMVKQQAATAFKRIGQPLDELYKKGGKWDFLLQPMATVHLHSANVPGRITTLGDIKYVYIFSVIALFIMVLACVNFMNLSTAQSSKRAKEIGVRKVLGSAKGQLIKQFLAEALMYCFIASLVALVMVFILLKPFDNLSGKNLNISQFFFGGTWMFVLILAVITGLLAGSYPAFYLSAFRPVSVFQKIKSAASGTGNLLLRNGLVILQFTVSTILIISTIVVFQQLRFTQNKNLGLDKENVVVISNTNRLGNSEKSFRDEVSKIPGVVAASISTSIPTKDLFGDGYVPQPQGNDEPANNDVALNSFMVDENFIPALKIGLITGRNFSRDFSDSSSVILNEAAVKEIGWKEPLGKYIKYAGNNDQEFKVIGVVKDFNIESIRYAVIPFALFHSSSKTYELPTSYTLVRVTPGDIGKTLTALKTKWSGFSSDTPFVYSFLDSEFDELYNNEKRMGAVFALFTLLSLFIACLGLFGLAAYTAERRTKEIGIRKVLGATVTSVVTLLSKDFVKLVLIATVIAFPLAWWMMSKWLEDFAYRISISCGVFIIAGLCALSIALLTVSFQSIKAAIMNPVGALRSE